MMSDTIQLAYDRHGAGIPLILLHGYPLNRSIWRDVPPHVMDIADVILPNLRGHGDSPAPDGIYSMQIMAGDVIRLMDTLSIDKAVIAGHSMGGYVSLALTRDYPDRVLGLGLITTQAAADSPERYQARLETVEEVKRYGPKVVTESMIERLTANASLYPGLRAILSGASVEGLTGTLLGIAGREDARGWLGNITVPTLILSGARDAIIPRERAFEMAAGIPNAWWVEIPGCGHMPMMEDPQSTGLALRSLLATVQAKTRS